MWEWSYDESALAYANEQLHSKSKSELLKIVQDWNYFFRTKRNGVGKLKLAKDLRGATLADWIWEQASSWDYGRRCSNGGHEIYLDRDGYHVVDLRDMPKDWQPSDY